MAILNLHEFAQKRSVDGKCNQCGQELYAIPNVPGLTFDFPVLNICDCINSAFKEYSDRIEQERLSHESDRNAQRVFDGKENLMQHTFANDNKSQMTRFRAMEKYAKDFPNNSVKGMMLYGPVATGKTFYASCIANVLVKRHFNVIFKSATTIVDELFHSSGKTKYVDNLMSCDMLIIDDLGAQRNTEYATEQLFKIIDNRIEKLKPMIITSNIDPHGPDVITDINKERIYSRICGHCFPVEFKALAVNYYEEEQQSMEV